MIKKFNLGVDVLTIAKQRIINSFKNKQDVTLSLSGGKDSIVLSELMYRLAKSGEIDPKRIEVIFVDEEAVYPSVDEVMKSWRIKWLSLGSKFSWFAMEYKHFNCFNLLQNDESFICWDETKKDSWVRPKPTFAISHHPLFTPREQSYQDFLTRYCSGRVNSVGLRVSESFRRRNAIAQSKGNNYVYPIYDWYDSDIWRYIRDSKVEFPDAYLFMYQIGLTKKNLRISQFFSIDTARSLVQMTEFYPELFNKILKREPNAYLATLYWDTEMFRKTEKTVKPNEDGTVEVRDSNYYKMKIFELLKNNAFFITPSQKDTQKQMKKFFTKHGTIITGLRETHAKRIFQFMYEIAYGGDPKGRSSQALLNQLFHFVKVEETERRKKSNGK